MGHNYILVEQDYIGRSKVSVDLGQSPKGTTVGIFGRFAALALSFVAPSPPSSAAAMSVWAQDLTAVADAQDITGDVVWGSAGKTTTLTVPGTVIDRVGTSGRSRADDVSPPGLVLRVVVAV